MKPEERITQLEQQVASLEQLVQEQGLVREELPQALEPYVSTSQSSSDGYIPMVIRGKRYNVLVTPVT
jgi:hypothetical protein